MEQMILFGADFKTLQNSLRSYVSNLEYRDREYTVGLELKFIDEEINRANRMIEELDKIEQFQMKHVIQVDLGPRSYESNLK